MATNTKMANAGVNAEGDALAALLNSGFIKIYDGTQAATADTAIGAQVLLATLTFGNPAFGSASAGVITANPISPDTDADATGAATWFRCTKSDGTAVFDGNISTSGANLNLNSTAIQQHAQVSCSSFVHTVTK